MAVQTVSVDRNYDHSAISGLLNGETVTINGGAKLTINSDVRWSAQGAVLGSVTIDSVQGGEMHIDGTTVWWLPYSGGTGTVPARAASDGAVVTVTQAATGATGELLAVFSALGVAETTPGLTIPATGFLKLRAKTGTFNASALTISGVTANATGPGQRGWLHIVGAEAATVTVPRAGTMRITGDWFELGTTSGALGQTMQYYVADYCPMVQVETAAGSGVYETWVDASTTRWASATQTIASDARGRFFSCSAAGVISFAVATSGFLPPAGCKVRVPNIHISSSTATSWAANTLPNATLATRYDLTTTSAGSILFDKVNASGFYMLTAQAYKTEIRNSGFYTSVNISECATPVVLENVGVGIIQAQKAVPLILTSNYAGGSITGCHFVLYSATAAGDYATNWTRCSLFTVSDSRFVALGTTVTSNARGNAATGAATLTQVTDSQFTNCTFIGGRILATTCQRLGFTGTQYSDVPIGATATTIPDAVWNLTTGCDAITMNGLSYYANLANVHPYTALLTTTNCSNIKFRNVGTAASPLNLGTANACGLIYNNVGGTITVALQRIYTINSRTGIHTGINSDSELLMENVWGDAADVVSSQNLGCAIRGCYGNSGTPTTAFTSVYGNHYWDSFISATQGRMGIYMNEPQAPTATFGYNGNSITTESGALFLSTGAIKLATIGARATWTWPWYVLGLTGMANVAPVLTGTNTANMLVEYDTDKGSGFSNVWKTLNAANLSAETGISATTGVKFKVRATCTVANATNALTGIYWTTATDATSQRTQYPLDLVTLNITGLKTNSEVRIYKSDLSAELAGVEDSSTTFSTVIEPQSVVIVIHHLNYQSLRYDNFSVSANTTLPVFQIGDRQYLNP
jgi:hypothetical protein